MVVSFILFRHLNSGKATTSKQKLTVLLQSKKQLKKKRKADILLKMKKKQKHLSCQMMNGNDVITW
jgi:hypothetical protein